MQNGENNRIYLPGFEGRLDEAKRIRSHTGGAHEGAQYIPISLARAMSSVTAHELILDCHTSLGHHLSSQKTKTQPSTIVNLGLSLHSSWTDRGVGGAAEAAT